MNRSSFLAGKRALAALALTASTLLAAPLAADTVWVNVELEGAPAAVWAAQARAAGQAVGDTEIEAYRADLAAAQDAFLADLANLGVDYVVSGRDVPHLDGNSTRIDHRYTLVLNAVALQVDRGDLATLRSLPQVAKLHPVRAHSLDLDRSVAYTRADRVYGAVAELTQYDDFREGLEGQGLNVAIIDSGIDWSHDMFGGDPSPPRIGVLPEVAAASTNPKVIYYLPLVDGAIDDYGHGTHVAATAAGYLGYAPGDDGLPNTADDVPVHGVAPQARIMGYKVCNASGTCINLDTITALEDAVSARTLTGFPKPRAHAINLSLGGDGGPDDDTAIAASNAALLGAVVVAAAGNDGPGQDTLGSPAAGRHVLAVAASNDPGVFPNSILALGNDGAPLPSVDPMPAILAPDSNLGQPIAEPIEGRYVFAGIADTPTAVPLTVAGNVCLVERGSTAEAAGNGTGLFANKAAQCALKGAIAAVIFNNEPGEIGSVLAPAAIPVLTITREDGLYLRDGLGFDATGISLHPIRLNPVDPSLYAPGIAGFSSRGPVLGLGQVKPEVAAPGVDVLAATTMVGAPAASMQDPTRYTSASGTSMATPHVTGAAALVRQAHPGWTPAEIRAALTNTATNPREADGTPDADGLATDDILSQGGGLIDVEAAVSAPALLGVTGDGILAPSILAGHSFGRERVLDTLVINGVSTTVTLQDLTGAGGTYSLAVANNRDADLAGVSVTTSPSTVTVPAGGSATFTLAIDVDGSAARGHETHRDVQGFVVATGNGATLRMPFFLRATPSQPVGTPTGSRTTVLEDTLLAGTPFIRFGDLEGVTWMDVPFTVGRDTLEIDATLDFDATINDLDLILIDPDGVELGRSENAGGPEHIRAAATWPGTYTYRVVGWLNAPTDFTITSTEAIAAPPVPQPIPGDFTGADGIPVDFDGTVTFSWQPHGNETGFEVERSIAGGPWERVASVGPGTTSHTAAGLPGGTHGFRVRGITAGRTGSFVTGASAASTVLVDRRSKVTITNKVDTVISNVSFVSGVFQLDLAMVNQGKTYFPRVELAITKITSASGTVEVIDADNGGDGRSTPTAALFDYSYQLGADEVFTPGEMSGPRTLRFADPAAELFTFRAKVTAFQNEPDPAASRAPMTAEAATVGQGGTAALGLPGVEELLEFNVNPLTGSVTVELVSP